MTVQTWNCISKLWTNCIISLKCLTLPLQSFCLATSTQACQTQCYWSQIGTKKTVNNPSVILNDFLLDHEMIVANFAYKQDVSCTYKKGNSSSYIDHVIISGYTREAIQDCALMCRDSDDISDHLALTLTLRIQTPIPSSQPRRKITTLHLHTHVFSGRI